MFELPTLSPTPYHGKYPNRIRSIGYSDSPCQRFIATFLGIKRPVHLELNCGRRFIACMTEIRMDQQIHSRDISHVTVEGVTPIEPLTVHRYDEMLTGIRLIRGYSRD